MVLRHETPDGVEWWAYGTGSSQGNALEEDGRMFPVLHSRDLHHWEYVGGALKPLSSTTPLDYWAPEVAFNARNGKFWMYYAANAHGNMQTRVAVASHPAGPFVDCERVMFPDEPFCIDCHPFHDPQTGNWYAFVAVNRLEDHAWGEEHAGTALAATPLGPDMMTPLEPLRLVMSGNADWHVFASPREMNGRVWQSWHTLEGAFVVFHAGRYYCLYSGGCWGNGSYGVGYGVADHPLGPWRDMSLNGPNVLRGVPGQVIGPGHNSVVEGPDGRLWIAYHAWGADMTARRFCLDPLVWDDSSDGPIPRCDGPSFS